MTDQQRAQRGAERFAESKSRKYLEHFLTDSRFKELVPELFKLMESEHTKNLIRGGEQLNFRFTQEHVMTMLDHVFGKWLALSYAVGWVEALENRADRRAKLKIVEPPPKATLPKDFIKGDDPA